MAQLTPDRLEALLVEYGWAFEAAGPNLWQTGFKGDRRFYPLHIRYSPTCLSFEVRPLLDKRIEPLVMQELALELLELNARLQLVKVAVDEDGEMNLSCQVLVAAFDFEMLTRILGIIGYYADAVTLEIDERLAALATRGRPLLLS